MQIIFLRENTYEIWIKIVEKAKKNVECGMWDRA